MYSGFILFSSWSLERSVALNCIVSFFLFFGRGQQEKEEGSDMWHSPMAFDSMGNSPQPCILRRLIFFNSLCMTMSAESGS